ncbi:import receptor subunit TOM20-like [Methylobacter tundripaludum]|uniref:Import receptor subunit TOM20-like n=1 Tax=Methylobacter tundripaludum TaxID=173365 RepID=A0A2S6HAA3_9GAMM|nr:SIR2 family protein [Methylobacter tundripaludum]PPK74360.1 import receptor subunit TOM20-like [Methylobacter tundripaludum]
MDKIQTATIEELAYFIKQARDNSHSPIFFLGAGASKTGGIPLAGEIVTDILKNHSDNPRIKSLKTDEKTYPKLMECLGSDGQNKLLKGYIDASKINVTHIYLAQLIKEGYVDYMLTVNFDNLMLKALALFNEFPSTYDMAILKDLTTTTFKEKSVVYLHGQHHGLWLLNTKDEMAKVREIITPILHSIKDQRPWVFIGYSGSDPIFEHIKSLGRFDNGLYWVAHYDEKPCEAVCNGLLKKSNTNAFVIEGYDADSFMLKLNSELGLPQPEIIDKPFSSIRSLLNNIVDIDDKEHFKGVKQRLEIAKAQVTEAIQQFEQGNIETTDKILANTESDLLKKEIIDLIINEDYQQDKIDQIAVKAVPLKNDEINNLIANLYFNWGTDIGSLTDTKSGDEAEALYQQAFDKFHKTIEIKPNDGDAFYNWGTYLLNLANTKSDDQAEALYRQAIEKFSMATDIKPDSHQAFNNWGNTLDRLANIRLGDEAEALYQQAFGKYLRAIEINPSKNEAFNNWGNSLGLFANTKSGDQAEVLYQQAFDKFHKAIDIKPDYHVAFCNWGTYLGNLAKTKSSDQAKDLYRQAFNKYRKAVEIKPDYHEAFYNWGTNLSHLAKTKSGDEAETLYQQAFDKYQKAIDIKPDKHEAFNNWGNDLLNLAKTQSGDQAETLYQQALEKLQKAVELGGSCYNLACTYAVMQDKDNALLYLNRSLENKQIEAEFVTDDTDWAGFLDDEDFKAVINRYAKL